MSTDADGLRTMEGDWRRLAAAHAELPMQDAAWARSAAEAFGERGAVTVEAVWRAGALVGVAPLLRRRGHAEILGGRELYEPADLMAADPDALAELCRALVRRGVPILMQRVPVGSATIPALLDAVGRRGHVIVRDAPGTPMLALDDRWAELGGGLRKRRRSDLRRAERRAEKQGEVDVRILRPEPGEAAALLDAAFAVEARSQLGESGTALAHDPALGAFFRAYAPRAAADGHLVVAFLDIGDATAAMQIAVEWRDRLWLLKIGYDEEFSRCSPGVVLMAHVVRDAAQRGLRGVELLGPQQPWLEPWTTAMRDLRLVVAYPLHPRAVPGVTLDAVDAVRRPEVRAAAAGLAARPVRAAVARAQARYVAGPSIDDVRRLEGTYAEDGYPTIIGYWDGADDTAEQVAAEYRAAIDALAARADAQISIKVPSLDDRPEAVAELIAHALPSGTGVHIDAMEPGRQDTALDIACGLAPSAGGLLGCTLTGRWPRSVQDAARVAAAGLKIRVVKSEWPSPEAPDHDARRGFLDVVGALCEASPARVQVATHDAPLADRALRLLVEAGIPCEHQVLHGMRAQPAMEAARLLGVQTRIFIPYGTGRVPYSVRAAVRDPHAAYRLARDLVRRNNRISLT